MDFSSVLKLGKQTLEIERDALNNLIQTLDHNFESAVQWTAELKGRLVISGIGKSGIVAQKIVATLNSTGTPSMYMHAADAIHGDLGMINPNDLVLCISKSGNSPEIKALVPLIRSYGNRVIGMTADKNSFLGENSDLVLYTPIEQEACPNNLAPTTSTTLQMALGDALAVALMEVKGFSSGDFAKFHPGGALGKKLYLSLSELLNPELTAAVNPSCNLKEAVLAISKNRVGAVAIVDHGKLKGIITDGDLRRLMEKDIPWNTTLVVDVMNTNPTSAPADELAISAFRKMEEKSISQIAVLDGNQNYLGLVHLHDILKEGIF
ncbi:MAG: arabinose-5-phosphate isomerase [Sphingobacteriales bacterium]|jgi:arabinose-5-phosphate isomerase